MPSPLQSLQPLMRCWPRPGSRARPRGCGGSYRLFVPDAQLAQEMAHYRASLHQVGNGVAQLTKKMVEANQEGQAAQAFSKLQLAQLRGLARFVLDAADKIDLLVRRRREAIKLEATAALKEFIHAAE